MRWSLSPGGDDDPFGRTGASSDYPPGGPDAPRPGTPRRSPDVSRSPHSGASGARALPSSRAPPAGAVSRVPGAGHPHRQDRRHGAHHAGSWRVAGPLSQGGDHRPGATGPPGAPPRAPRGRPPRAAPGQPPAAGSRRPLRSGDRLHAGRGAAGRSFGPSVSCEAAGRLPCGRAAGLLQPAWRAGRKAEAHRGSEPRSARFAGRAGDIHPTGALRLGRRARGCPGRTGCARRRRAARGGPPGRSLPEPALVSGTFRRAHHLPHRAMRRRLHRGGRTGRAAPDAKGLRRHTRRAACGGAVHPPADGPFGLVRFVCGEQFGAAARRRGAGCADRVGHGAQRPVALRASRPGRSRGAQGAPLLALPARPLLAPHVSAIGRDGRSAGPSRSGAPDATAADGGTVSRAARPAHANGSVARRPGLVWAGTLETRPRPRAAGPSLSILHLITRLDRGGSSDCTLQQAIAAARRGHRVTLASGPSTAPSPLLIEAGRQPGLEIVSMPGLRREVSPLDDARAFVGLLRLLRSRRFDIVHTHTSKAGALGRLAAALTTRSPVVHQPHGHLFYGYHGCIATRLVILADRLLAPLAARQIVLSWRGAEEHLARRGGGPGPFTGGGAGVGPRPVPGPPGVPRP